ERPLRLRLRHRKKAGREPVNRKDPTGVPGLFFVRPFSDLSVFRRQGPESRRFEGGRAKGSFPVATIFVVIPFNYFENAFARSGHVAHGRRPSSRRLEARRTRRGVFSPIGPSRL